MEQRFNWNRFPYEEIEVKDLMTSDYVSRAKSVSMFDPLNDKMKEVAVVSSDYLLVSNKECRDLQDEFASKTGIPFSESKVMFNGKSYARFLKTDQFTQSVSVGDDIALGLYAMNSYDGSVKLQFGLYAERLICSNGMVSKSIFESYVFKHDKANQTWAEKLNESFQILYVGYAESNLKDFVGHLRSMSQTGIDLNCLADIRKNELKQLPISTWGHVVDQFITQEEHTKYGLYNAVTHELWHKDDTSAADIKTIRNITDLMLLSA